MGFAGVNMVEPGESTACDVRYVNGRRDHFWPPLNRAERRKRAKAEARILKRTKKAKR